MLLKPTRILYIDAWRFIAVAMVIVSHILKFSNPWYRENLPWIIMARAQSLGQFGVEIFFCISGFVICRGLIAEKKADDRISMKAFYVRRFLRIAPPLFLYLLALELFTMCELINVQPSQLAYAGLFLCNIDLGKCGWLLAHTWSLAYEEQFYLFFPLVFVASSAFGGRRAILALTIFIICLSLLALYGSLDKLSFAASTFTCMLSGCVCAMYWDVIEPVCARISVTPWLAIVACAYTVSCIVIWPVHFGLALNVLVVPFLICIMVLATPVKSQYIADFFCNPTITYLGKISFTVYLWQQLATSADYIKNPWLNLAALAGTVVIGILSYRYFERPFIRLGSAYSRKIKVPVATAQQFDKVLD